MVELQEKERKIIETFGKVVSKLSEKDKSFLLGLGEGMNIKVELEEKKKSEDKLISSPHQLSFEDILSDKDV